ncbi:MULTISPECIES: hypothetical protein [Paenibacillus]|uniref:Sporulation membrane protein YtrI C-terminal domain-containing protein n=1 Tax=Paenibacillus campinasensis TaxID=66347 RepID=A0A268F1E5_9BACL|nr:MULTISPECIES: hypothetical protein [Paenibacillus]MUG68922.1 hypothetical protein [Paenibacillus campinasensis]PAD79192.1 hypothetical protein CHH67_04465 [Paenibacillus campinasensis]PAK54186.1 hypothetical protein CHH75_07655 [Paenibacillus sp. 7541]
MRVPPFERFRPFYQATSIFLLGMIVGSVFYNSLYHASYNKLWHTNHEQQVEIQQLKDDITSLKKYSTQTTVIREIKIRAEDNGKAPLDALIEREIIKLMGEDLAPLRGRNVFDIDTDSRLTRSLLDDKIYTVREKDYRIRIRTMLVMEGVLQIWITISQMDANAG